MARIEPVPSERMTAEQRQLHDAIAARRSGGKVRGPFAALLHAPDIGARVADMVDHLLSDTRVPHRLKELAILAIARRYTAQYEWFVHERRARDRGLDHAVIESIRAGDRPVFTDNNDALVYEMVEQLTDRRALDPETFARGVAAFGEPAMVELVALIGFYTMIAVFLVAFDIEAPDGAANPLPP